MIIVESQIPCLKPPAGITQATVVKAAWALSLSRFAATPNDITFGVTTSGRILNSLATNSIFGLCINRVPVRVRMESTLSLI
jgi:non-ribosomal peptide synthetase component F